MTPYLILLALLVFFAYGSRLIKGDAGVRNASIFIVSFLLILFQGVRDRLVGTDTGVYVRRFEFVSSTADIWRSTEIGYNALNVYLSLLFDSYSALLIAVAAIVVGAYALGITMMVKRYELALFLFVTLGVYTLPFNATRQGIAVAICFLALPWLLRRRPLPYFFLVGLAALFHHTAIIAAPLYLVVMARVDWRYVTGVAIGTVLLTAGFSTVVQLSARLLSDAYSVYADEHAGGGGLMATFLVAQGVCLYFLRPRNNGDQENYSRLFSIYLIGLIPALASVMLSVNPSGVLRLHFYFSHVAILLWPIALNQIKSARLRTLIYSGLVLVVLSFFFLTTTTFSNLTPYRINPELLN